MSKPPASELNPVWQTGKSPRKVVFLIQSYKRRKQNLLIYAVTHQSIPLGNPHKFPPSDGIFLCLELPDTYRKNLVLMQVCRKNMVMHRMSGFGFDNINR